MFAQESVMEIQRQAFQEWYIANHHDGDIHPNQQLLEWSEKGGFYFASSVEDLWEAWQATKAQAVPEGFVLVPVKEIKTWYLDDSEGIYREDPEWLCDIPVGEVVEVEHRVSYELDQDPVFAAIQWDKENSDVGYYETFKSKVEAEKVAAHCKAMIEAQEQSHECQNP